MIRRKIQLIAGTTYSISLPKEWILNNNLKEGEELTIIEKLDKTLIISPKINHEKKLESISVDVDDYGSNMEQILFSIFCLGIDEIILFSKKEISKEARLNIRKALSYMSGTEVTYEDKHKICIKVLIDKTKIDIMQALFRMSLLIELSLTSISEDKTLEEIKLNEKEIDRLYHLVTKIVSLSLTNQSILETSKIGNRILIPHYFLISKRMENIGDNIIKLGKYIQKNNKIKFEKKAEIMSFFKKLLKRSTKHILSNFPSVYEKTKEEEIIQFLQILEKIKDRTIQENTKETLRYIIDIEEETINLSFYHKLIKEGIID